MQICAVVLFLFAVWMVVTTIARVRWRNFEEADRALHIAALFFIASGIFAIASR